MNWSSQEWTQRKSSHGGSSGYPDSKLDFTSETAGFVMDYGGFGGVTWELVPEEVVV